MEHLLRSFHETWRAGIEAINRDVMKSFANLKLGMDILKQVRVRVRVRVGVRARGLGLGLGLGSSSGWTSSSRCSPCCSSTTRAQP